MPKISDLTTQATPITTAVVPVVQSGTTFKATLLSLFDTLTAYIQTGIGVVARTITSRLQEKVSVKDFGATGDGTTDDTSAIQAALAWIKTRGRGGKLIFPAGTYCISGTLPLDSSGLVVEGEGADEGRVTWGKWPTRIKWIGSATDNMLEIDSLLTGTVRGGTIRGLVIDAQDTSGVNPLYANPSSSHWRLQNVCFRNYGAGSARVYLGTSCYGWDIDDVEIFNSQNIGIHLEGLNHHTTFRRLRGAGTGVTAATSLVRVGESDRCSNINFIACDFEAQNTTYQVELLNCRAVSVQGGYSEVTSNGITAIFRLGVTGTSTVEGFSMNGFYVQGNDPTYTFAQAINILNASGVDIGGGNHFRNITTAVINANSTACPNSNFGAGNYLESVGGGTVKFANLSTGWSFHDSGTTTPTVVGTGGSANAYTTQKCQYWVRDGRCFFDLEITLSALNSTGALTIETSIPYTAAINYDYSVSIGQYSGLTLAAGNILTAYVTRNTNDINLRESVGVGTGSTSVLNTEASATMSIKCSGNFPIQPGP